MSTNTRIDTCSCCGGDLPASWGPALDARDCYLVREDGMCPGHLAVDGAGRVLGCGAWSEEAYGPSEEEEEEEG